MLFARTTRNALLAFLMALVVACSVALFGCSETSSSNSSAAKSSSSNAVSTVQRSDSPTVSVSEDGEYSSRDEVAAYIHEFGHLPSNYVTKSEAKKAGWQSSKGNLWDVLPGRSIGGDRFYNDEKLLPEAVGRLWLECDIGYNGGSRNAKRIVYSSDGLIYYTNDHYVSFEQLY